MFLNATFVLQSNIFNVILTYSLYMSQHKIFTLDNLSLQEIDSDLYGINTKFVEDCYPMEDDTANRILQSELTKRQKSSLKTIFRDIS